MANKKQLAILKQGVAAWNKWREENPDAKIDLRGARLNGLDLSGANFCNADIRGASFKYSILKHVDFKKCNIGQDFKGFSIQLLLSFMFGCSTFSILSPFSFFAILQKDDLLFLAVIYFISIFISIFLIKNIDIIIKLFFFVTSICFVLMLHLLVIGELGVGLGFFVGLILLVVFLFILLTFCSFLCFFSSNYFMYLFSVIFSFFMLVIYNTDFSWSHLDNRESTIFFLILINVIINISCFKYLLEKKKYNKNNHLLTWKRVVSSLLCTNFHKSILIDSTFEGSLVQHAVFDNVKLFNVSFINVHDLECARCNGTILEDRDVRELLVRGNGHGFSLKGKNLQGAHLVNADLRGLDLRETDLMQANLSGADITGAKLYGSARENWIIDGIRCDYVYWDEAGMQRTPPDRNFRPGEFEELYKQIPTFEYVFANGFTPLDPLIMDRVVQAVNQRHKEFSLELVNFDKRGQPHATFTVCRLDYVDAAKGQLTVLYENTIAYLMKENEDKKRIIDRLNDSIDQLIRKTPSLEGVKLGDTYNNYGQVAAMGKKATASGNTFQQITADLSRLHEEMQRSAKTPEQRAAAEDVAKAAQAAQQQNEPAVRQHLKNAGKFALDCAQKIGAEALAEYLKKMTLGM